MAINGTNIKSQSGLRTLTSIRTRQITNHVDMIRYGNGNDLEHQWQQLPNIRHPASLTPIVTPIRGVMPHFSRAQVKLVYRWALLSGETCVRSA
jgi:hypothetical protein